MTLEHFVSLIPHNGPHMLQRLMRIQPPAGSVYSEDILDDRSRAAAAWLRGYMHALHDLGRIADEDGDSIHTAISRWEARPHQFEG